MILALLLSACRGPSLAQDGGLELVYRVNVAQAVAERPEDDPGEVVAAAIDQVARTMQARADEISDDATVTTEGQRVMVRLVGTDHDAAGLLGKTARLEFLPDANPEAADAVAALLSADASEPLRGESALFAPRPDGTSAEASLAPLRKHVESHRLPAGLRVAYEKKPGVWATRVLLDDDSLTGAQVASVDLLEDGALAITFDKRGKVALASLTAAHTGRMLAMVVDDEVLVAPKVMEPIRGGKLVLNLGPEPPLPAEDLAVVLLAGSLPSPVTLESVRIIGITSQ